MPYEFHSRQRVEFADTDMAGIMHFSNYFRFMERTEHEFLRSLGLSVHPADGEEFISLPRVNAECNYRCPLAYEDEVDIHLLVREKRSKSICYEFRFRKRGEESLVAVGSITVVTVLFDRATSGMKAIPIPESIDRLIEAAPPELWADRGGCDLKGSQTAAP
jgi:YbgC/YbaW family acyl-CoA thioester hydrolase